MSAGVAVVSLERIMESMEPFLGENLRWGREHGRYDGGLRKFGV